ncbi:four-carbon acid sugar kinase family protein [Chelativorans sp.]|uniref:four-carbon acid sugar kinase family protein n=1 Tax=Chelativorans sp. TaxID=2203393 RepID=UPI0028113618|nr:four-carbon acid sugar kinase family protein [Chelativorans sp.]
MKSTDPDLASRERPLIAWYGDDFTGSAAAMEVLSFAGIPSVLFLRVPSEEQRARFAGHAGIGLAGTARAHPPEWMEQHLPEAFGFLKGLGPELFHYKLCSTLDSSPAIGSIGRAIEIGRRVVADAPVPLLVAAPPMRRYQVFGNLFAGAPVTVHRLDRHPVMRRHPVTPMDEADVRLHLARQTALPLGLVDLVDLRENASADAAWRREREGGAGIVALDALDEPSLAEAGRLLWENRSASPFVAGSQGVQYALVAHFRQIGAIAPIDLVPRVPERSPVAVVSGSVSPITEAQIGEAVARGFAEVPLDVAAVVQGGSRDAVRQAVERASRLIGDGRSTIVHAARGPADPRVATLARIAAAENLSSAQIGARIGEALAEILAALLERTGVRRAIVAGGDTSGAVMGALGIYALTALAPTVPGASLFRAHADAAALDGLEIALKGGQMGSPDFFDWIRRGNESGPA